MPHDTPLITTIVAGLVLAFIFGAIANRFKMPPLVGYLVAGVLVGPHSPGFVADQTLASQLADIGVILLMFGVGLNFSLVDLLSVRAVAIPGALIRLAGATALGVGFAALMGWSLMGGLVFGLALSVSSTVVLLKALQDRHLVDSDRGRLAVGWLIVEDVAMVLALVLIPAFASQGGVVHGAPDPFVTLTEQLLNTHLGLPGVIAVTSVKLLAFIGFMVVVGRRIIPFILHSTAHTGSRELFRLAVLAIALGVAAGAAYLFGVSIALGAFFAGMILSESQLSQRAAQETLPLRDAFGVLFFVSVGMLFDPTIIVREPLPVIATLFIILFGKSIIGFLLLVLFRRPVATALTISAGLAQIGEFSFILAALGVGLGMLPAEGRDLILAGAMISIIVNPLMFWAAEHLRPRLEARAARRAEGELGPVVPDTPEALAAAASEAGEGLEEVAHPTRLTNHVILIGYGRVGRVVATELKREEVPFVLIEDAERPVQSAREAHIEVIVGNAATRTALMLANVMGARCVVIAIPNAFEAGQATEQCRKLNEGIKIIARSHSEEETGYLLHLGADEVIMGEREIGLGMIDWLKGETRRENVPTLKLAGGENLLEQARAGQTAAPVAASLPSIGAEAATVLAPARPTVAPEAQNPATPRPDETINPPHPADTAAVVSVDAGEEPGLEAPAMATAPSAASKTEEPAEPAAITPAALAAASVAASLPEGAEPVVVTWPAEPAPADAAPSAVEPVPVAAGAVDSFWVDKEEPAETAKPEPQLFEPARATPAPQTPTETPAPVSWRANEDAPWMAALERDLFGGHAAPPPPVVAPAEPPTVPGPAEVPQPTPQPIETPRPAEVPQPTPQPIETPQPSEDPVPVPQPIETPQPTEIPPTTPRAADDVEVEEPAPAAGRVPPTAPVPPLAPIPPVAPEPVSGERTIRVEPEPYDPMGRKEPRLY